MRILRILLVDDDQEFLTIMSQRIKSWGYEVLTVFTGREAIEMIKEKKADIVILDYKMPDIDGIATLAEIRKLDERIPVLVFTSFPDKRSLAGTEKLGVSAYIPKYSVFSDAESSLKNSIQIIEKRLGGEQDKGNAQ